MSEIYPVGQTSVEYTPHVGQVVAEGLNVAHSQEPRRQQEVRTDAIAKEAIEQQSETLNQVVQLFNHKLKFEVDERSDNVIVKIVDSQSGETIRQIPPEDMLNMKARLNEVLGMMFDEKA